MNRHPFPKPLRLLVLTTLSIAASCGVGTDSEFYVDDDAELAQSEAALVATGVRAYRSIGTKNWIERAFDSPTRGWAVNEYNNRGIKEAYEKYPCAFTKHSPALTASVKWSETYVNPNLKPTRAQARDPNWSNYKWNKAGAPSAGRVWDGLSDALGSPMIDHGRGPVKLLVLLTYTSTGGNLNPPVWMRKESALTWEESTNSNGSTQNWHVRMDNGTAVDHVSDFMEAFLKKFGNDRGISQIELGEYFLGRADDIPSGLSRSAYLNGVKELWRHVVKVAPRDSSGRRVNFTQMSPIEYPGIIDDLKSIGMGLGQSDTYLNLPVAGSPSEKYKEAYDKGVYVMMGGDARYACIAGNIRNWGWDGTANPFGHAKGYSGVATPQELFWYHGQRGPVPMHSIFMTLQENCRPKAQFIDAIKRFGRCGTQSSWGPSPAE